MLHQVNNPTFRLRAFYIAVSVLVSLNGLSVLAQTQPAPGVEWTSITWAPNYPTFGTTYEWNGTVWVPATIQPSGPRDREEGGEEWWYGQCNIFESGIHVGYVAVGYAGHKNWAIPDPIGCYSSDPGGFDDRPSELGKLGSMKGATIRGTIARFDLEGNIIWGRAYNPGSFYAVMQASDESIVAVGEGVGNIEFPGLPSIAIRHNPASASDPDISDANLFDCGSLGNHIGKMHAVKVDLDGNLQWFNYYGAEDDPEVAWSLSGLALDVAEIDNGTEKAYYMVGYSKDVAAAASQSDFGMALRLDPDGYVLDKHFFGPSDPMVDVWSPNVQYAPKTQVRLTGLAKHPTEN